MPLSEFRLSKIDPGEYLGVEENASTMPGIVVALELSIQALSGFSSPSLFPQTQSYIYRVFLGEMDP